jgi:hypothetical protein
VTTPLLVPHVLGVFPGLSTETRNRVFDVRTSAQRRTRSAVLTFGEALYSADSKARGLPRCILCENLESETSLTSTRAYLSMCTQLVRPAG